MVSFFAAALVMMSQPSVDPIYLDCAFVEGSNANPRKWYPASVTADEPRFISDAFKTGAVGFIANPPSTWEIDLGTREISSPENGNAPYTIQSESRSSVIGLRTAPAGSWFSFNYNRINNRLTLSAGPTEALRAEWKEVTGGEMPILITTVHQCRRVTIQ